MIPVFFLSPVCSKLYTGYRSSVGAQIRNQHSRNPHMRAFTQVERKKKKPSKARRKSRKIQQSRGTTAQRMRSEKLECKRGLKPRGKKNGRHLQGMVVVIRTLAEGGIVLCKDESELFASSVKVHRKSFLCNRS